MKNEEQSYCVDARTGKRVYQSGNDPMNPNGYNRYLINGREVWAYSYKDARMKYKHGINCKKLGI